MTQTLDDTAAAAPELAPGIRAGDRIGPYVVHRTLGTGGFGVVLGGIHTELDKRVAIKILTGSTRDADVDQFLTEARLVNRIHHPNIVEVFDHGVVGGRHWLAMDLLGGESLAHRMIRDGVVPVAEALRIIRAVGDALDAAHAAGVIHRDIKPANIFLLSGGGVKLLDFGLGKLVDTGTTTVAGSPHYMAPEQFSGTGLCRETDIYGLGATLFHMLVGRPVFVADSFERLCHDHCAVPPPSPSAVSPALRALDAGIVAMLAKQPRDRPRSAAAALAAFTGAGEREAPWISDDPRAQPHPEAQHVFVGRAAELAALAAATPRVCFVQGMAGIGKSYLVDRLWFTTGAAFPGGYLRVAVTAGATPETLRDALLDQLACEAATDRWLALRARFARRRMLVHLENVDTPAAATAAAAIATRLPDCALVLTGRLIGAGAGRRDWLVVALEPLSDVEAASQLHCEAPLAKPDVVARLVERLGGNPLALHLAASHLAGGSAATLERVLARGMALAPYDPADPLLAADRRRATLDATIALSLDALRDELEARGEDGGQLIAAFAAVGYSPAAGFGDDLGAALVGLDAATAAVLFATAERMACLERVHTARTDGNTAWRVHPIVRDILARRTARDPVAERLAHWIRERLPRRWSELVDETPALVEYLASVGAEDARTLCAIGPAYALRNGPYLAWARVAALAAGAGPHPLHELRARLLVRAGAAVEARAAAALAGQAVVLRIHAELLVEHGKLVEARGAIAEASAAIAVDDRDGSDHLAAVRAKLSRLRGDDDAETRSTGRVVDAALHVIVSRGLRGSPRAAVDELRATIVPAFEAAADRTGLVEVHTAVAELLLLGGAYDEAMAELHERARPLLDSLGNQRQRAHAHLIAVRVYLARGDYASALGLLFREVEPICRANDDALGLARARRARADIAAALGELRTARGLYEDEVIPKLRELGALQEQLDALEALVDVHVATGELALGDQLLSTACSEVAAELGTDRARAVVELARARIAVARGEHAIATAILDRYVASSDARQRATALGLAARLAFARGDYQAALGCHDSELAVYREIGDRRSEAVTLGEIADAYTAIGDHVSARHVRDDLEIPLYAAIGDLRSLALASAKVASRMLATGDATGAVALLDQDALPVLARLGDRRSEVLVTLTKVAALLELGRREDVRILARSIDGDLATAGVDPELARRIRRLAS